MKFKISGYLFFQFSWPSNIESVKKSLVFFLNFIEKQQINNLTRLMVPL